jgi:hypothetical protein
MMNERIKMQGRKVEKQKKLKELEIQADNLIGTVRDHVDPFEEWLKIDSSHALRAMQELNETIQKGRIIRGDILKLEKALGE